jgi:HSP20 family protein
MFNLMPWRKTENTLAEVHPFNRLRSEFDELFERFFRGFPLMDWGGGSNWGWGLDVEETDKEVIVKAEAPGFEAEEFDLAVRGDTLTIRAEHKTESKDDKNGEYKSTRRIERMVRLPAGVDADRIEAKYRNGVLELKLPRTPEAVGRKIEVKKA